MSTIPKANTAEHLKMIKFLQAKYAGKKFYVECYPTDNGAIKLPNSNWAVKYIEFPSIQLATDGLEELEKIIETLQKMNSKKDCTIADLYRENERLKENRIVEGL